MLSQTKELKNLLKSLNITRSWGTLSVRVERNHIGNGYYEYGPAVAHTRAISDEEIEKLVKANKYINIYVNRELDFSIIKSYGSKITVV